MGRIFAIKRFEIHDGDGVRTTLFLKGCPLRCAWCHNPEGLSPAIQLGYLAEKCLHCGHCTALCTAHHMEHSQHIFEPALCHTCGQCAITCPSSALTLFGTERTALSLLPDLLADRAYYEATGGGVTLSGGEPMAQPEFTREILALLKKENIHTALDTCGFAPRAAYESILPYTDLFLFDLKAADPETHLRCTGQRNDLILENLRFLDESGLPIDIRIPLVPDMNDTELPAMARLLQSMKHLRKVKILPYHHYSGSRYQSLRMPYSLSALTPPSPEAVSRAVWMLRDAGLPATDHREEIPCR